MSQPENPHQAIYNIAALCAAHGLTEVVLSPGSRSAPLTLAFARHPATNVRVVPDERAAAFIGLGIAQARRVPTVLVCTSGTAGLNYAPAVAEAYYQQVPLLILTADRPPEWIDQLDGQTIRQNGMYGAHVKASYTFPTETTHPDAKWHANRLMNEAINLAKAYPPGPVHINIPLREPLYPTGEVVFEEVRVIQETENLPLPDASTLRELADELVKVERVLVVFGQESTYATLRFIGHTPSGEPREPYLLPGMAVVADIISNLGTWAMSADQWEICTSQDIFLSSLGDAEKRALQPDLLITCGLSLISKSLKQFLRAYPAKQHWHLQVAGEVADNFRSLTRIIRIEPSRFLPSLAQAKQSLESDLTKTEQARIQYDTLWYSYEQKASAFACTNAHFPGKEGQVFNEFSAFRKIINGIPRYSALHLANSMAVRYANILGLPLEYEIEVFANRGTSGIDGCTSTAVGYALAEPEKQVVLITGDVAFFYDRNAFWHNYPTPNLRVVLLNNHGGGIFRLIDGPRQQPELDEFFETRQQLTAENLCRDFHLPYFPVDSWEKLEAALPVFFGPEGAGGVLEIQTDSKVNAAFFEEYRAAVKQAFS